MTDKKKYVTLVKKYDGVTPNANGVIYSPEALKKAVDEHQNLAGSGKWLGGTFLNGDFQKYPLPLSEVSHVVREVSMDGDIVQAQIELLDTPRGKFLQSMIEAGQKPTMGIAALASVEEDDTVRNMDLSTIDVIGFEEDK
jgi:hypothetical protein